jgi:hypothetical protein
VWPSRKLRETVYERLGKVANVASVSHDSHVMPGQRIRVAGWRGLISVTHTLAQRNDTDDRRDEAAETDSF